MTDSCRIGSNFCLKISQGRTTSLDKFARSTILHYEIMIRRDYILRMIEEFFQALARIKALKNTRQWREADAGIDEECQRLIGMDVQSAAGLSETELLAVLVR